MVTLTWTSMNIDSYKAHVHHGLKRLEQLVTGINDVIEHRIENNLKVLTQCDFLQFLNLKLRRRRRRGAAPPRRRRHDHTRVYASRE